MNIDVNEKLAGLLVPTFALRTDADLGIGDTTAMMQAIDFCRQNNLGVLQVLPINETGGDNSPYNAISSVALDPVLLSVVPGMIPGLSQKLWDELASDELLTGLRKGSIQYPRVKNLKLDLLAAAFKAFEKEGTAVEQERFAEFQRQHRDWLTPYTLFRTLVNEYAGNACWPMWDPDVQSLESAQKWLADSPEHQRLSSYREFCAYVQWIAFDQWKNLKAYAEKNNVALMGDIPFGVSRYSADVWAHRELFDLEWSGGAPPERFFQTDLFIQRWGQNWGIPLYKWENHQAQQYAWWQQRVQRLADFFHFFRIDHVLGFFRVYSFPWMPERNPEFVELSEAEAAELTGNRLPQFLPHADEPEELAQINCAQGEQILKMILKASGKMGVVAEDLGVVPDYVRPLLKKLGIPGFYIPIFERVEEDRSYKPKKDMPPLSLGTYATHDHAPLAVFYDDLAQRWQGPDGHQAWLELQRLMQYLGLDENHPPQQWNTDLQKALFESLLDSPCWLAMFMITDVLGSKQRFNEPGSSSESNWSQRLDRPLNSYVDDPLFGPRIKMLSELIQTTHRLPVAPATAPSG